MIARYSHPEMLKIWDERHRYLLWLRIELAVCEELSKRGRIPKAAWKTLERKCKKLVDQGGVDPERVAFHEAKTKHDVIAFTTAVAEKVGPMSRYIHFGLTSSDVVDTALCLQIKEACELLLTEVGSLLSVLKRLALRYQNLPTIGRSHGIFAEPTSFGLKFLGWFAEIKRDVARLESAMHGAAVGKLSGAVGANPHFGVGFEKTVLKKLGLAREIVSTQVIPRDRHAEVFQALALLGAGIERIAVELRHLQRSEVGEVIEGFAKGQKGSSAMPHKRNPISSENLTGVARLLRGYAQASIENIALWHERDISHSSVERVAFPDAFLLAHYSVKRMTKVLTELHVREDRVKENLERAGKTVFSGHFLLALVEAGKTREEAYSWVQGCAIQSLEEGSNFVELLVAHPKISSVLAPSYIRELGSLTYQLREVAKIYKEVLKPV